MTYIWFQEHQSRLASELAALRHLQSSVQWLIHTHWGTDQRLYLDAVIRAHGHDYHVRMEYPAYFPAVPPSVRPTNATFRWTSHQYGGNDGPLCLEWGPDIWHPEVTGAQMLESAYTLFNLENPLGQRGAACVNPAPSRHSLAPGQEIRTHRGRFYLGKSLEETLNTLPHHSMGIITFSAHARQNSWFALFHTIEHSSLHQAAIDTAIPLCIREGENKDKLCIGVYFKTDLAPEAVSDLTFVHHLRGLLWQNRFDVGMLSEPVKSNMLGLTTRPFGVLMLDQANTAHFFLLLDALIYKLAPVHTAMSAGVRRMPEYLDELAAKSVGIVGLGSAGSKIATSLARIGVAAFFLVDYDIFLPENIERNELDWSHVGEHKVDAVSTLLSRINANSKVTVSRLHLTGQESTDAVAQAIVQLSQCDIIIDATANPTVFALLAAVATEAHKPMVWLEVFGGGVGGLIARSRPGLDPEPLNIKLAYSLFCQAHPVPDGDGINYAIEHPDGQVQTASDADVSIIASHAVRLAVDTVLGRDPSAYPYSLYLIGLEQWWVFTQPLHTIPIPLDHPVQQVPSEQPPPINDQQIQTAIKNILDSMQANANPASS